MYLSKYKNGGECVARPDRVTNILHGFGCNGYRLCRIVHPPRPRRATGDKHSTQLILPHQRICLGLSG